MNWVQTPVPALVGDNDLDNRVSGFMAGKDLDWNDISDQKRRTYLFRNGSTTVSNPVRLHEKRSGQGFSHRIIDVKNEAHYIPSNWLAFTYEMPDIDALDEDGWSDLSDEIWRTYHFDDHEITISDPSRLLVNRTELGDVHTVVDDDGAVHVIAAGWLRLSWASRNTGNPVSFG